MLKKKKKHATSTSTEAKKYNLTVNKQSSV